MQTAKASTRSSRVSFFPRSDFDLALTLRSGQVFRWRERPSPGEAAPFFTGWIGSSFARISQEANRLLVRGVSEDSARNFFSLDTDLPALLQQIDVDPVIREAIRCYPGLRVIRQDPWECATSFLLSAFNNIPRLTQMLEALSQRFGEEAGAMPASASRRALPAIPGPGLGPASHERGMARPNRFPRPEALARVSERVLRGCGLGYRAPYLKAAAEKVAAGEVDLEKLHGMGDEELRRALLVLPGIGEKVVECVMLFAYGRTSAFPVDVWIGRAMREWYFRGRRVNDRHIREFAREHFGPYCGWAQQYLYCLARWQSGNPSV